MEDSNTKNTEKPPFKDELSETIIFIYGNSQIRPSSITVSKTCPRERVHTIGRLFAAPFFVSPAIYINIEGDEIPHEGENLTLIIAEENGRLTKTTFFNLTGTDKNTWLATHIHSSKIEIKKAERFLSHTGAFPNALETLNNLLQAVKENSSFRKNHQTIFRRTLNGERINTKPIKEE